jgi:protease YdgD
VIGINVGTYVQSKVLMQEGKVKKRLKADPVANTAVASAAFAAKLDAFLQVAVLSSQAQVRELQTLLKARQLFDGKVDGTYSADLRDGIEAYEKAEGLAVTGLATVALLKRLGGGLVPVERAKAPRKARS